MKILQKLIQLSIFMGYTGMALHTISFEVNAQNTFYRTLGHITEGSEGRVVAEASDGGYFLAYYIYLSGDYISCITKMNCAGTKEWEVFYDGGMVTLPTEIIPQPDNGCLFSLSIRNDVGEWQHVVTRFNESGNSLWTTRLKMQAGNITGGMVQHSDGSIYICGSDTISPTGSTGTTVARLNASGNVEWQQHFADGQSHSPLGITITSDNKIAIFGQAGYSTLPFTNVFVFTITTSGQFIKRKIFSTYYDDEPKAICSDNSGNIYITGNSYFLNTQWDIMFLKLNSQLTIVQAKFIDGATFNGEKPRHLIHTLDNSIAVFGDEGTFDERNPMIMKLSTDGNPIWSKRYTISPQFTNYLFHGAECADGGFLATGDARPVSQFRIAPFMKTGSDGEMGCLTSDFPVSTRNELFTELDTSLIKYSVPYSADFTPVPTYLPSFQTSNTAFCQQLIPCGNFASMQDSICPRSCFTFTDQSINSGTWNWIFENGIPSSSTEQNPPPVCFPDPGNHQVILTLTNPIGTVVYTQTVNVSSDCPISIPNIFTPNGDGPNELFYAKNVIEDFSLQIFNRWGQEIFTAKNPGKWWDGKSNGGDDATEGVYFYVLHLRKRDKIFNGALELRR